MISTTAWPIALATALWFGFMARRAGRCWGVWALSGAILGLVLATIVLGISVAAWGPLPGVKDASFRLKSAAAAVGVVLIFGWLVIRPLRESVWRVHRTHSESRVDGA